jgi:thiamine kinase-like enzyme
MIDAAYLWAGKGGLKEGRYSQFKKQTEVVKPSSQMHTALKEVFKQLKEANKIADYTKQLKNELSENNSVAYTKRSEAIISKLMQETANLYKNLKEIKDGSKSKN